MDIVPDALRQEFTKAFRDEYYPSNKPANILEEFVKQFQYQHCTERKYTTHMYGDAIKNLSNSRAYTVQLEGYVLEKALLPDGRAPQTIVATVGGGMVFMSSGTDYYLWKESDEDVYDPVTEKTVRRVTYRKFTPPIKDSTHYYNPTKDAKETGTNTEKKDYKGAPTAYNSLYYIPDWIVSIFKFKYTGCTACMRVYIRHMSNRKGLCIIINMSR